MQLFFTSGSPYARMVRIALIETGLDARIRLEEVTLRDPESSLLPFNPVGRVPSLRLDNGQVLTETLLILPYLDRLHDRPRLMPSAPARLAELGRAMGLLEGIAVWNRELRRPPKDRSSAVIALETTRANRVADALEQDVGAGGYVGILDAPLIALGCTLGYCERRHKKWPWRQGRPALAAWFDRIAENPAFQATVPPENTL
jgi:glutathione S-transferase